MAQRKPVIAAVVGIAVVGIISFLGYKLTKELNKFDIDDDIWENLDDVFHYRTPTDR